MDALTRELHDPPRPRSMRLRARAAPITPGEALNDQEVAVLRLIAQGMTYDEIGRLRHLAEETIRYYAKRIYRKLDARCAAHAVHIAHQRGLLGGPSTSASTPVHKQTGGA